MQAEEWLPKVIHQSEDVAKEGLDIIEAKLLDAFANLSGIEKESALQQLESALIPLLGSFHKSVREKSVKLLNAVYDGHCWQLEAPFPPVVACVGEPLDVDYDLFDCTNLEKCAVEFFGPSGLESQHLDPSFNTDDEGNQSLVFALPSPQIPGFYDWRLAQTKDRSSKTVVSAVSNGDPLSGPVQGRFIVLPANSREEFMHEVVVDLHDAKVGQSGQFVSRGSFKSVKGSLPKYKSQGITSLLLHGALERDNGGPPDYPRPDTSPIAIVCRRTPNRMLGGSEEFKEVSVEAKAQGIKLMVDITASVSSARRHRRYRDEYLTYTTDQFGNKVIHRGTDGRENEYADLSLPNFRLPEVWNLLIDDILSLARNYEVRGVRLGEGQSLPVMMQVDIEEMFRFDVDGERHYSDLEVLHGTRVVANKESGYWMADASSLYPNPFYVKLTRTIWKEFPEFHVLASAAWEREDRLAASGAIPHSISLAQSLAHVFDKELLKNGVVKHSPSNRKNIAAMNEMLTNVYETLPSGATLLQSTCSNLSPYPSLMYGRGSWVAVDLLFFLPGLPMRFIGEEQGRAYRVDITNVYQSTHSDLPRVSSWTPQAKSTGMSRVRSLSKLVDMTNLESMEDEFHQQVGPEYGFDLDKIAAHYSHRAKVRFSHPALVYGRVVRLEARHKYGRHDQVFAFARCTDTEAYIVASNLNDTYSHFTLDLLALMEVYEEVEAGTLVLELVDVLAEDKSLGEYFTLDEITKGAYFTSLPPYTSLCWKVVAHERDNQGIEKKLLESSLRRLHRCFEAELVVGSNLILSLIEDSINAGSMNPLFDALKILGDLNTISLDQDMEVDDGEVSKVRQTKPFDVLRRACYACADRSEKREQIILDLLAKSRTTKDDEAALALQQSNDLGPVVFIAPELGKWSTVGGLGVMVDELTQQLAMLGVKVYVISPYYDRNRKGQTGYLAQDNINWTFNIHLRVGSETVELGVHEGCVNGVNLIFLHNHAFFPRPYPGGAPTHQLKTICLMGKSSLEVLCQLKIIPSLVITNDWFAGMTAAYAKNDFFGTVFKDTTFFHLVHNLESTYEGRIYPEKFQGDLGSVHNLPSELLVDPYWSNTVLNPSRCAILCSDTWGTVSPSYRNDLLSSSALSSILKIAPAPFAHTNGIPIDIRMQRLREKAGSSHSEAKEKLQRKYFPHALPDPTTPLFSFVGRITSQKGVALILDAIPDLIALFNGRIQVIVGGMSTPGDPYSMACAERMTQLRIQHSNSFWADPDQFFTDGPLVNLGSDFGLMPSLFEPGGIVQHEFFVAGTPVVAFKTGGLKDSVIEFNPNTQTGCGVTFEAHNKDDLVYAVKRACAVFANDENYKVLRKNAFDATMDLSTVSWAWYREFCRIRMVLSGNKNDRESQKEHDGVDEMKSKIVFRWPHGAKESVKVAGSFDSWKSQTPLGLAKSRDGLRDEYVGSLDVDSGTYLYKFIVDGAWVIDHNQPTQRDGSNVNNLAIVK